MHPVDLELGCFSCSYFENMKAAPVPPGPSRFLEVPLGPSSWAAGLSSSNFRTQPRRLATRHRRGHMGHLGAGGPGAWVKLRAGRKAGEQQQVLQRRFHGRHAKNSDLLGPTTSNDESRVSNVSWYNVLICACVCVCTVHTAIGSIDIHVTWTSQKWNMKRKPIPAVLCFADERTLDGRKMTLNNMAEEGSKSSGCWIWHRCSHPHKVAKECPKLWHKKLERSLHQLLDVDWQKDYCW